ncbi:MAG: 4'-phosphopantetheinyl transferase superfamily protein [Mediterranea sp.]|jgi:phosphopantetheinyl transferase|nr:4'-phosphopantetheinyl transferase superfamily protein [Mediterranea sp.]
MPLFLKHVEDKYQWGIWKISESVEELLYLLPRRKEHEKEIQHFAAVHRRLEWLSVRVLFYNLLGEDKKIMYYSTGKPYFSDYSHHISISHTHNYVTVIFSRTAEVSIDIEQYGERIRRVAHKYIRNDEQLSIYFNNDIWSLLLHWSAKEIIFKCIDTNAVDFRKHLRIYPFQIQEQGTFQAKEYRTVKQQNFLIHYIIHPEFVMTWQMTESIRDLLNL